MINQPRDGSDPIVVVGIGCRMPGDVKSSSDLWRLLMSKRIGNVAKVPASRFNIDAYLHPKNERPGSFNVPGGYFLEDDPHAFDPGLFNISPVEALWMDPQQRKLLEVVYEAFESCGATLSDVAGRQTGCFIGSFTCDFQHMISKEPDFRHAYVSSGIDNGILGSRISYVFDLKGPSLMVNTACSSSLYALDAACKAILAGECDSAVVGGTNLILTADQQMNTARMGVLSPTSQSHTFDESADGYGRAEGVGALYLKRLSDAIRDGNPIRAAIRSTATGSNGKSKDGMTHPSIKGQMEVIASAYKLGNLSPDDTFYVECHGTGTVIGDPVEVEALARAMGDPKSRTRPILIGSIKPNIGHSEAASSMGTMIKAILTLENGIIPPTAGIKKLNTSIPWDDLKVKVVTEPTCFPASTPLRRVGISAFGYGGTNAHAIFESPLTVVPGYHCHKVMDHAEGDSQARSCTGPDADRPHLLLFSAHDAPTLRNNITDLSMRCSRFEMIDLAYTFGLHRTKLSQRTFAIGRKKSLEADIVAASSDIVPAIVEKVNLAFIFTGQGAQWAQMGVALVKMFPSILETIQALDRHLAALINSPLWKIETVMVEPEASSVINDPEYSQPVCTALQIALVDLLARWGIRPLSTIGHSSGEIAAAYAAGRISAQSAITAAYFRGKVAASLRNDGAMLAVGISPGELLPYLSQDPYRGKVVVACHNSPTSATLSGDSEAIEQLKTDLDRRKIFARVLRTGGKAYHSHHMQEAAAKYLQYLDQESVERLNPLSKVPMFSTVTAMQMDSHDRTIADSYWAENLTKPVLFKEGVQHMLSQMPETNLLIEVGPHTALAGPIRQICQATNKTSVVYLPTLERKKHDGEQMLALAGRLWARNAPIDVHAVTGIENMSKDGSINTRTGSLIVDLPPYHWTYSKSCWAEPRLSQEHRQIKEPRHDILGRRVFGMPDLEPTWRNILRQKDLPWLSQHRLGGEVMMPAAGYLALAVEAITQLNSRSASPLEIQSYTLRDIIISAATVVADDDHGTETMFRLQALGGSPATPNDSIAGQWYHFTASCSSYGAWKETARGKIALNVKGLSVHNKPRTLEETPDRTSHSSWLDKLRSVGFDLGPSFHHIRNLYTNGKTHLARGDMTISKECGMIDAESRYVIHPTVLDSCLQPFLASIHQGRIDELRCGTIPTHFREATIFLPSSEQLENRCMLQVWTPRLGNRAFHSNAQLIAHDGQLLVDLVGCRNLLYETAVPRDMRGNLRKDLYLKLDWKIDTDYLGWVSDVGGKHGSDLPIATAIDLFVHKNATARVLCLDTSIVSAILALRPQMDLTVAVQTDQQKAAIATQYPEKEYLRVTKFNPADNTGQLESYFDLVVSTHTKHTEQRALRRIRNVTVAGGRLLLNTTPAETVSLDNRLKSVGFSGIDHTLSDATILSSAIVPTPTLNGVPAALDGNILLVYKDKPTSLLCKVKHRLTDDGWSVRSQSIACVDNEIGGRLQVILLVDTESPFLAQLTHEQLHRLINLTETASAITWVTCGGLLTGDKPEYGMTAGAARVIRKEKESLDLVTLDFDVGGTSEDRVTALLADIADRQRKNGRNGETEYYLKDDVVYVGRLVSHRDLNLQLVPDTSDTTVLHQRDHPPVHGRLEEGQVVFYEDYARFTKPLGPDEVEVHVEAIGFSLSDGAPDTNFLNQEIAGTVTRVGSKVTTFAAGTHVVGLAYDKLATFQRTTATLVQEIPPNCSAERAVTLPAAFATAIYGLEELAKIEPEQYVAITHDLGPVTLAAIQLCRVLGAHPILVTSSTSIDDVVRESELLSDVRVVSIRNGSLATQIVEATGRVGLDILLCSTISDDLLITECEQCLVRFGRLVSVGDSTNFASAFSSLSSYNRNLSVFQFDLKSITEQRQHIVGRILERCMTLYRDSYFTPLSPMVVKRPDMINEVMRAVSTDNRMRKYVLSYAQDVSFKTTPSRAPLRFRGDVTYLLVGCLGGLGRSVASWMAARGAKHLAFVSRTGADNPAAAKLLSSLKKNGVEALVLCGDITRREDVVRVVSEIKPAVPIRGLVNAANVLRDAMFHNMTIENWREVADTKVKGSLNLHHVLKDEPLDFFVMTSSITSTLGSTGQTNYGAANAFLDSLARHRHSRGLPAMSLILPAVFGIGYFSEHRELEQTIKSKGMYGIGEKEMLEAFEVAMTAQSSLPEGVDHIAVGIQPRPLERAIRESGAHVPWQEDPRLNWLEMAVNRYGGASTADTTNSRESILATIRQAASPEQAAVAATAHIVRSLARLLMLEVDAVRPVHKSIAGHGLDSMIGAEFRNWVFREFAVNIPFQQLLAGSMTIADLASKLCETVRGEKG